MSMTQHLLKLILLKCMLNFDSSKILKTIKKKNARLKSNINYNNRVKVIDPGPNYKINFLINYLNPRWKLTPNKSKYLSHKPALFSPWCSTFSRRIHNFYFKVWYISDLKIVFEIHLSYQNCILVQRCFFNVHP